MRAYEWLRQYKTAYLGLVASLIIAVLAVVVGSCSSDSESKVMAESKPIFLSGSLTNMTDTTLVFTYTPFELLATKQEIKVSVDSAGGFNLDFESAVPVKGFLSFGKVPATYAFNIIQVNGRDSSLSVESVDFRMVWFWLEPGDSIRMSVDPDRIGESLAFSGSATSNNVFINSEEGVFNSYKQKYLGNYYYITYCDPDDYKARIDQLKEDKLKFLHEFADTYPLSPNLIKVYETEYYTETVTRKIGYPGAHAGFNKDQPVELSGDYFRFIDEVTIDPEIAPYGIGYFYFLKSYLTKKRELTEGDQPDKSEFYEYVKSQLPEKTAYEFMAWALARDFRKELYDNFGADCPYPDIAKRVKSRYHEMEGLLEGSPAPDVTLQDTHGKTVELKDFRGQYVYIDFWATWCVPCIKEIPYLKKVEEAFHDRNIRFVSISFDKARDLEKWRKFVVDRQLSGFQLIADEQAHAMLSKIWNIDLIPRFVLLDPDGKIVDSNAPRPSDPKLIETLQISLDLEKM